MVLFLCLFRLCVVWIILKWLSEKLVEDRQWFSKGNVHRVWVCLFEFVGYGIFVFLGSFPWGVMVSSGSFSVVFPSGVFRLCVVRVILNWFLERLVGVIQWVRREV